jgi:hypothetical protein
MSASKNVDAMNSAQGEFSSRVPPSEPLTTKGVSLTSAISAHGNDPAMPPSVSQIMFDIPNDGC